MGGNHEGMELGGGGNDAAHARLLQRVSSEGNCITLCEAVQLKGEEIIAGKELRQHRESESAKSGSDQACRMSWQDSAPHKRTHTQYFEILPSSRVAKFI